MITFILLLATHQLTYHGAIIVVNFQNMNFEATTIILKNIITGFLGQVLSYGLSDGFFASSYAQPGFFLVPSPSNLLK